MKTLLSLLVAFFFTCPGFAHDDWAVPLPDPDKVFEITDVGQPNSPVRCFGKAKSYVTSEISDKTKIASWVSDEGLKVKNVSHKTITKMNVETLVMNTKGEIGQVLRDMDYTLPGAHPPIKAGETWEWKIKVSTWLSVGQRTIMTPEEYHNAKEFTPAVKAHIVSATFSDGGTYEEPEYNGPYPLEP